MNPQVTNNAATDANLKIEIQGLALTAFVNDQWKIFFPYVEGHDFKIKVTKKLEHTDQDTSVFILPRATKISFTINNTSGGASRNPSDWEESIDLSELHREPIYLSEDRRKYAGVLTLAGAALSSKKAEESEEFEIWEVLEKQKNLLGKKNPANIFTTEFQFGAGDSAVIKAENDFGFVLPFSFEDNVSYEVCILNDCEGKSCEDILDFKYLYNIIDITKFQTKRRFELIALRDSHKGFPGSRCGGSAASRIANPDVI